MINDFESLQQFIDEMKATPSSNKKKEILKKYKDNEFIMKVLLYTNNPYITYGVTSKQLSKSIDWNGVCYESLFVLLDNLTNRLITGHEAISCINLFIENYTKHEQLIYNIIDKDLETRANATLINKVIPGFIPEFKVALANVYEDKLVDFDKQEWYGSRKLDGVRCICRIDEYGNSKFFSRTGKEFFTLNKLKETIKKEKLLRDIVLDGEVCLVDKDGKEDFQSIMKVIKKKDYTIQNPKFFVFDYLQSEEFDSKVSTRTFSERLEQLKFIKDLKVIELLKQTKIVWGSKQFDVLKSYALDQGYEGVMLRKNVGYKGKRSNDLLKVKSFMDKEYKVIRTINDTMRFFENGEDVARETLAAVIIYHKGYEVKVGSGFTKEEREYYHNHPEEIKDKIITVRYFEETNNSKDNSISLRFPTFKCVHGTERTI